MSLVDFSQIRGGKQLQDNVDKKANITDVYNVDGAGKKTALYRKNTDKIVLEDLDKSLQDIINQPFTPRKINLVGNASGSATYDGLNDVNIDTTINESEHAVTADSADKLSTSKKINLIGNATGSTTFDGSTDANINVTVNESKHAATADKATTATNANHASSADSAADVTNATVSPGISNTDNATVPASGVINDLNSVTGSKNLTSTNKLRSYIGSINNGDWYNVISIRHRNGYNDGTNYGLLMYSNLTNTGDTIHYKKQCTNNWTEERTLLDSANYNNYAPTKTGGGASGTWGINITGNADTATTANTATSASVLNNSGNQTAITGAAAGGLRLYQVYDNGYPTPYGNVLSIGGTGDGQILAGWSGENNGIERLYYRNRRDQCSTWSAWKTVAYYNDINAHNTANGTHADIRKAVTDGDAATLASAKSYADTSRTNAEKNAATAASKLYLKSASTDGGIFTFTRGDGTTQAVTVVADNAAAHNAIYRGKDLTNAWKAGTVSAHIKDGTFHDIFPGDYINMPIVVDGVTIQVKWLIADLDYELYTSESALTTHHVDVVPQDVLNVNTRMCATNDTTGGYVASEMWTKTIPKYVTAIQNAFGSGHVLKHREVLTNAVSASAPAGGGAGWVGSSSGWGWYDVYVNLMNENMVYGGRVWGSGNDTGERTSQLALFRLNPSARIAGYRGNRTDRKWYWLTAVASASRFARCVSFGDADYGDASYADGRGGLRPHFLLY